MGTPHIGHPALGQAEGHMAWLGRLSVPPSPSRPAPWAEDSGSLGGPLLPGEMVGFKGTLGWVIGGNANLLHPWGCLLSGQLSSEGGGHHGHPLGMFPKSRDAIGTGEEGSRVFGRKVLEWFSDESFLGPLESFMTEALCIYNGRAAGWVGVSQGEEECPRDTGEVAGGRWRKRRDHRELWGVLASPPGLCVFLST